jgi:hypothetical protein
MELKDKTVDELKIMAYDLMASLQQTQRNLEVVNNLIAQKLQELPTIKSDGTEKP